MTRTQIAARSLLTGLVVYAGIVLLNAAAMMPSYLYPATSLGILAVVCCVGLLIVAWFYLVQISGWLLPEPAEDDEILAPGPAGRLLCQALTLTMVTLGLVLLPRAVPTLVGLLKTPFVLRTWITAAIVDHELPGLGLTTAEWFRRIYDLARMLLTLYLLYGAPQLVRRLVRRAQNQTGSASQS